MNQRWRWGSLLVVVLTAASVSGAEPRVAADEPHEEDIRLLEVVLDETLLSEDTAAYAGSGGGTLLPLGAMSELLGVAITTDVEAGQASGFVLEEHRVFVLDVARGQVTVSGRAQRFDRELVRVFPDDIYVDSTLLDEWLPVAFDIDLFALRVRVRPREPLPLQKRLERERRIRHWRLQLPSADPGYPRFRTAYRFWEVPSVDQTLRLSLGGLETIGTFATYATGDLLYMESEGYLSGSDEDPLDEWRMTLRRRDPAGSIGSWLRATEFALGHVIHPTSTLLASSSEPAPGVLLTNIPLHRAAEFDRHSFRGNLPPGWDVELYQNDALIDYQTSRPDGQYSFENVPLLFGMNFFRLVFYGPQGQRRKEEHRFLLGDSLTVPGKLEYRVVVNTEDTDTRRASMLLSYGINRHLTASVEAASLPVFGEERRYAKVGLRTFWGSLFSYADYVADHQGEQAYEAGVQARLLGVNVQAARARLSRGFASDAFRITADPIVLRDRLRLDTAVAAWILPRIPISLEVERQRMRSGATRTVAQNRISTNYKGLSISNRTTWTSAMELPSRLDAALQFSRYIRRVGIRGELLYSISPTTFTTANFVIERPIASGYRLYANISRSFIDSQHVFSLGVDKIAGSFAAGVDARYHARGELSSNLTLSAGFGREPREGTWISSARSRAPFGALSARVFVDRNLSGAFDAGDELLQNVGVTIDGVPRPERTDRNGIAYLSELSPHRPTDLAIDTKTLEDPQWMPDLDGARITPRPGTAAVIDLAVIQTSEIEGTVTRLRRGRSEAIAGVAIELVDEKSVVVQRATSAYDGFYVLSHVRPGRYRIQVTGGPQGAPVTVDGSIASRIVDVSTAQPVLAGIDFHLTEPSVEQALPPVVIAQRPEVAAPTPAEPTPAVPRLAEPTDVVVQLGTFTVAGNADRLAAATRDLAPDVTIERVGRYWVVRTGPRTRSDAEALQRRLTMRRVAALVVSASSARRRMPETVASGRFVVQLGAFNVARNAMTLVRRLAQHRVRIDHRNDLYFVEAGPFATRHQALDALAALRRVGADGIVRSAPSQR